MLVRWENVKNWIDKERFKALTPEQVELLHSLVAMHPDADPHYLIDQILAVSAEMQAVQRRPISEEARRNVVATAMFERVLEGSCDQKKRKTVSRFGGEELSAPVDAPARSQAGGAS